MGLPINRPRRVGTAQARHRCGPDHGRKVHGKEATTAVAGLEDLSTQSRRRHCIDGSVPGPDNLLSAVVRIADLAAWSSRASVGGRHGASDSGMDCSPTDRGIRVAAGAALHHSRPRWRLWPRCFSRLRAMGIRDRPIAGRSPWQNGCTERLIGSIRRDCLDHVVVFGERHLRHLLKAYQKYYNEARTHLSLQKDAPIPRAVQAIGQTLALPILGGLHHLYVRT